MRRVITVGTAAVAVVLALAACRPADDDPGDPGDNGDNGGVTFDAGVTEDPCPDAVNDDNGCIYLGSLTDLTGPFAGFGGPLGTAQEAFWQRVNEEGGIVTADGQAFDVNVTEYRRDTGDDSAEHSRLYEEIKDNILALAQTLGTDTTLAILDDLRQSDIVAVPAGYTSLFNFEEVILESMVNYCVESMNAFDYALETYDVSKVAAVYFPNDFGGDAAGGVKLAAEQHDIEFVDVPTPPGPEQQSEAVGRILSENPDVVFVATGPTELAAVVGGAASQGFTGRFIGSNVTWNQALLESQAGEALIALYQVASPLEPWGTDSPGHQAMRDAIGEPAALNDGYTAGWMWQYPLKAALEAAAANNDLTRAGVRAAAAGLSDIDYEGMLPAGAGNYAGGPEAQFRQSTIGVPDPSQPTGSLTVQDWFVGPTAESWQPEVCYERMLG